jgi:hypothetical protein
LIEQLQWAATATIDGRQAPAATTASPRDVCLVKCTKQYSGALRPRPPPRRAAIEGELGVKERLFGLYRRRVGVAAAAQLVAEKSIERVGITPAVRLGPSCDVHDVTSREQNPLSVPPSAAPRRSV